MTKTNRMTVAASLVALATAVPAIAGPAPIVEAPAPTPSNGDWCHSLKTFGMFHKDKNASFIQELKFFGRFQWQAATVDGEDFSGVDVDDDFTEIRRFRIGTQVKFLNNFKLKVNANLEDGGPNNHSFGYHSLDEAKLTYSFGDWYVTYGRQKFAFSQEARTSSKKIKTIERSNISNYFYGSRRPTGVTIGGKSGDFSGSFSVFSTDEHPELAQWGEGTAFYLNLQYACACGDLNFDFLYNDAGAGDVDHFDGIEWATSLAYTTELGAWELMTNLLYGETMSGDAVYGLVIMPSTFLIKDRLEFVARYQYAGSDSDMLRFTSRYARRAGGNIGSSSFRGDENHTIYTGLNYYFCGHNSKIQVGVEYETMDRENGQDADAITGWFAYRMYF